MKTLSVGKHNQYLTIVDDEDFDYVAAFLWTFAVSHGHDRVHNVYVRRCIRIEGRKFDLFLHHVILERIGLARPGPEWTCDHRNCDTLDNRRQNLRWATPQQQAANRREARDEVKRAQRLKAMADEDIPF